MIRHDLPTSAWRKSSYSADTGSQCVEIQPTHDDLTAISDSKARPRGALAVPPRTWTAFVHAMRHSQLQPLRG
ncbi:DUF397 domain-containing protein [Streptomyces sp. NPDC002537]